MSDETAEMQKVLGRGETVLLQRRTYTLSRPLKLGKGKIRGKE